MSQYFFIRLDKMGDLISTLPVDQVSQLQNEKITWITAQGLENIFKTAQPQRRFVSLPLQKPWLAFWLLLKLLKSEKPQATLFFYGPWWASLACFIARVPNRAGRLSQWHHFLFFNKGIRQSRSLSEKHEADYNFDLVKNFFNLPSSLPTPFLRLKSTVPIELLQKHGLEAKKYYVVHPGMAGSALNWNIENWRELINLLAQEQTVLISGTSIDKVWLDQLRSDFSAHPKVLWAENKFSLVELLLLLEHSAGNVAPSTGVVHLSASTAAPTIGIYSPIKVQTPTRWGARGPKVFNIFPGVDCPARTQCLGEKCEYYYCLKQITPTQVISKIKWLSQEN